MLESTACRKGKYSFIKLVSVLYTHTHAQLYVCVCVCVQNCIWNELIMASVIAKKLEATVIENGVVEGVG